MKNPVKQFVTKDTFQSSFILTHTINAYILICTFYFNTMVSVAGGCHPMYCQEDCWWTGKHYGTCEGDNCVCHDYIK